jgi:hypothetical protein
VAFRQNPRPQAVIAERDVHSYGVLTLRSCELLGSAVQGPEARRPGRGSATRPFEEEALRSCDTRRASPGARVDAEVLDAELAGGRTRPRSFRCRCFAIPLDASRRATSGSDHRRLAARRSSRGGCGRKPVRPDEDGGPRVRRRRSKPACQSRLSSVVVRLVTHDVGLVTRPEDESPSLMYGAQRRSRRGERVGAIESSQTSVAFGTG